MRVDHRAGTISFRRGWAASQCATIPVVGVMVVTRRTNIVVVALVAYVVCWLLGLWGFTWWALSD